MRTDIEFNTYTHDIVLRDQNVSQRYPFAWVGNVGGHLQGTITLPDNFYDKQIYTKGIKIHIPYTPVYLPIQIKLIKENGGTTGGFENKWFDVMVKKYNIEVEMPVHASELDVINTQEEYLLCLEENKAYLWSAEDSDCHNENANIQNRDLLLQCVPSNSYRYPVSGVGLIKYLHMNVSTSNLASRLQSEFEKDGVTVISAAFDSDTGELDLQLDFTKVDDETV